MSANPARNSWSWRAVLMAVAALATCGCQATKTEVVPEASVAIYREALRASVVQTQPWKPLPTTTEEPTDPGVWQKKRHIYEFRPGEDVPETLLEKAKKGDVLAMAKLEFYVQQFKPRWKHRFELERMLAMHRGLEGIALFYAETRKGVPLRPDRRAIESALRQIQREAEQGSLIDAVVLYQFCGSLAPTKHGLPASKILTVSAQALESIAAHSGIRVMKNVAAYEAVRMGYAQEQFLNGDYYPHTPPGWTPSQSLNPPANASNLLLPGT